jgi:hypothetical protein
MINYSKLSEAEIIKIVEKNRLQHLVYESINERRQLEIII